MATDPNTPRCDDQHQDVRVYLLLLTLLVGLVLVAGAVYLSYQASEARSAHPGRRIRGGRPGSLRGHRHQEEVTCQPGGQATGTCAVHARRDSKVPGRIHRRAWEPAASRRGGGRAALLVFTA
ncbi:hypothetical protein [Streptomyces sp. NPDC000229]|uniref:hypothetical protein n=1 Tax=Streptomyces sp. NPDC000229 TaxID=3154247 RepID=UPI00332A3A44